MLLDASAWHTVSYNNLSYFANLRPKDCVCANSRCIFGVELKTRAKKAHDTQNLKVWDFFLQAEDMSRRHGSEFAAFFAEVRLRGNFCWTLF